MSKKFFEIANIYFTHSGVIFLSLYQKERLAVLLKEHNIADNNDGAGLTTVAESGHTKPGEDKAENKDESKSADPTSGGSGGGTVVQHKEEKDKETAEFSEYFVKFCDAELSEERILKKNLLLVFPDYIFVGDIYFPFCPPPSVAHV